MLQVRFGTLTDYFSALRERAGAVSQRPNTAQHMPAGYPVLSGDFYTYADRDDHYWSGYFTSRPFYKGLDRIVEGYQQYVAYCVFFRNWFSDFVAVEMFLTTVVCKKIVVKKREKVKKKTTVCVYC